MARITKMEYSLYKKMLWRLLRTAVAASVAQTLAMTVDWTEPEQAARTITISFIAGVLTAIGKAVRVEFGTRTQDSKVDRIII